MYEHVLLNRVMHLAMQETEDEHADTTNTEMPEAEVRPSSSTEPATARAADADAAGQSKIRESRRLLSTCMAVPEDIRAMYNMRADCVVSHVTHRNNTLPHIQVRLPPGERFQNKQLQDQSMILYLTEDSVNSVTCMRHEEMPAK